MNYHIRETSRYCEWIQSTSDQHTLTLIAPILEILELSLDPHATLNTTLLGTIEADSIYTQDPSPEVDAAWDIATAEGFELLSITRLEALSLGFDPSVIVKAPLDWDLGDDAYPVQINVFHQLHCLDEIRKQIFADYYYKPVFGDKYPPFHFAHKKHCIHILQRALMCQASVDIIPHYWREGATRPRADFNPNGKCKDFEKLVEWNRENSVRDINKKWARIKRPSDAVVLPAPTPRLYK